MSQKSTDSELIRSIVQQINAHWSERRYNEIGAMIAENAVIAPPESDQRVRGREAYVQSYRDYDTAVTTQEFHPDEPQIDVVGDVAVAICPFRVVYELQGTTHREQGYDLLVLARNSGEWRVVWRTMETKPSATSN